MKKHIPLRMCMACRQMKPKSELIRFVNSAGKVLIDTNMEIQSRGAYVCCTKDCITLLKKKRCLERHLKGDASEVSCEIDKILLEE